MEHSEVVVPIDKSLRVQRVLHALADRFTSEVILTQSSHYHGDMPSYVSEIQDGTAFDPDDAA